jgi:hypothetical protein
MFASSSPILSLYISDYSFENGTLLFLHFGMNLRAFFFNNLLSFNYLFNNHRYNSPNPNILLVSDFFRLIISRNQLVILLNDQSRLSHFLSYLIYIFIEILFKLSEISCLFYFKILSLLLLTLTQKLH